VLRRLETARRSRLGENSSAPVGLPKRNPSRTRLYIWTETFASNGGNDPDHTDLFNDAAKDLLK
jgi:hypothetical protein